MNIPLIYKQLFYKYLVCLFDGYTIKDITFFKKLLYIRFRDFLLNVFPLLSFLWSLNIWSITDFVRFSTYDCLFCSCIIFHSLTFCCFSSNASLLMDVVILVLTFLTNYDLFFNTYTCTDSLNQEVFSGIENNRSYICSVLEFGHS